MMPTVERLLTILLYEVRKLAGTFDKIKILDIVQIKMTNPASEI